MQHYCNYVKSTTIHFRACLRDFTSFSLYGDLKEKIIDLLDMKQHLKFRLLYL